MKICIKCKIEKSINDFRKEKRSPTGTSSRCKMCLNIEQNMKAHKENPNMAYKKINPIEDGGIKRCSKCNEKLLLKQFRQRKKRGKLCYNSSCKNCEKEYSKKYNQKIETKNKRSKYKKTKKYRDYENKRRKTNELFRLKTNLRQRVANAFKTILKIEKDCHTFDIIGISPNKLKEYIELKFRDGMNWNNMGMGGWQIDHIIPLSSAKTKEGLIKLCHYTNLQPLWWQANISKGNKMPDGTKP